MTRIKILLNVLTGVVIGTTVGIMVFPDRGSDSRKRVVREGKVYLALKERASIIWQWSKKKHSNSELKMGVIKYARLPGEFGQKASERYSNLRLM